MVNRALVLTLIFLSFDLRFDIAKAKSVEEACRDIFRSRGSGNCYYEDFRKACKKQCDEYLDLKKSTKDCLFGDALDGKYDCAKDITKNSCGTKCSNNAIGADRITGINCCGTCLNICKQSPLRKNLGK